MNILINGLPLKSVTFMGSTCLAETNHTDLGNAITNNNQDFDQHALIKIFDFICNYNTVFSMVASHFGLREMLILFLLTHNDLPAFFRSVLHEVKNYIKSMSIYIQTVLLIQNVKAFFKNLKEQLKSLIKQLKSSYKDLKIRVSPYVSINRLIIILVVSLGTIMIVYRKKPVEIVEPPKPQPKTFVEIIRMIIAAFRETANPVAV